VAHQGEGSSTPPSSTLPTIPSTLLESIERQAGACAVALGDLGTLGEAAALHLEKLQAEVRSLREHALAQGGAHHFLCKRARAAEVFLGNMAGEARALALGYRYSSLSAGDVKALVQLLAAPTGGAQ